MTRPASIEALVKDWADDKISKLFTKVYPENIPLNNEIEEAFKRSGSKIGNKGIARPDNKEICRDPQTNTDIPIMFEYKGYADRHVKYDNDGRVSIKTSAVNNYAVNGAIFYANAVLEYTSYDEVIAIGVSDGIEHKGQLRPTISAYYVSKTNYGEPIKISDFSNLDFLDQENFSVFMKSTRQLTLTDKERQEIHDQYDLDLSTVLKDLNELLNDMGVDVSVRVNLVSGMIMASMPSSTVEDFEPLPYNDLKGLDPTSTRSDGAKINDAVADFLKHKQIPNRKKDQIKRKLTDIFLTESLSDPNVGYSQGESKLKTIYRYVVNHILPFYSRGFMLDFTGKLFDTMNSWVQVPDSGKNDIVLTPRYVTKMMAKLCGVNKDSYVWDLTAGSGGFLVSSMDLMLQDAIRSYEFNELERQKIITHVKEKQLLGVEKNSEMYMLAVLNMILMGDGSSNIINDDSLAFNGCYRFPEGKKDEKFPANVFLLNPPYSAPGHGLNFLEKGVELMRKKNTSNSNTNIYSGNAAIIIQESAGGPDFTHMQMRILAHNSLVASIHMPGDLFLGKSGVQTAIFLFKVGIPHDFKSLVKFVDFSSDGYRRTNRKKARQNLFNDFDAPGHYDELVRLIRYDNPDTLHYFSLKENYFKDVISPDGGDWQYKKHITRDNTPDVKDFEKVVRSYLAYEVTKVVETDND